MKIIIEGGATVGDITEQIKKELVSQKLIEGDNTTDDYISDYEYVNFKHIIVEILV